MIPLWAIKLGAISAASLVLFSAGAYSHMRWSSAKAAKAALLASEQARKVERESAVSAIRKLDNFAAEQAANERRALTARSDLERLRGSLATLASPAPAASCPVDERSARAVELFGESLELLEEGRRHVERLKSQRDALSRP
jgi:hypothetical protein